MIPYCYKASHTVITVIILFKNKKPEEQMVLLMQPLCCQSSPRSELTTRLTTTCHDSEPTCKIFHFISPICTQSPEYHLQKTDAARKDRIAMHTFTPRMNTTAVRSNRHRPTVIYSTRFARTHEEFTNR